MFPPRLAVCEGLFRGFRIFIGKHPPPSFCPPDDYFSGHLEFSQYISWDFPSAFPHCSAQDRTLSTFVSKAVNDWRETHSCEALV